MWVWTEITFLLQLAPLDLMRCSMSSMHAALAVTFAISTGDPTYPEHVREDL